MRKPRKELTPTEIAARDAAQREASERRKQKKLESQAMNLSIPWVIAYDYVGNRRTRTMFPVVECHGLCVRDRKGDIVAYCWGDRARATYRKATERDLPDMLGLPE